MFSSNASQASNPIFIEDVFSTYLYTGTGASQTITNNIDLSTKGGLTWIKQRSGTQDHTIFDTARGVNNYLRSNSSGAQNPGGTYTDLLTSFNTTGFSLGADASTAGFVNASGSTYVSWTFRKQPKFFDIVTWTGAGVQQTLTHSLGGMPGMIIGKSFGGGSSGWGVWHRNNGITPKLLSLDSTAAAGSPASTVTESTFTTNDFGAAVGYQYIAYLFAHDAGGFGLTGTDNVISCGSVTTNGSGLSVTLGWEPQFVMLKPSSSIGAWYMFDNLRPFSVNTGGDAHLEANSTNIESLIGDCLPNATGFTSGSFGTTGQQLIYIAIRRGPMKVPTLGTSVFNSISRTGNGTASTVVNVGFAPDTLWSMLRAGNYAYAFCDKLRGVSQSFFIPSNTGAEGSDTTYGSVAVQSMTNTGVIFGTDSGVARYNFNWGSPFIQHFFQRAPGFFDEVCYTGTGANTTQAHNLGVVPELIIVKGRSGATAWDSYCSALANTQYIVLNTTAAAATGATRWNSTTPTSSVFSIGTSTTTNTSAATYVAYLFATCPGVSKVGSYTGNGTTQTINCGFTGGARFVLIKRTDSTGSWYVWDTARGIVAGNDPYLLLNSTAAEITNTDYIDTYSAGFELSSTAPADINANGGTYIFLAIA
jgi:hypothetical protein